MWLLNLGLIACRQIEQPEVPSLPIPSISTEFTWSSPWPDLLSWPDSIQAKWVDSLLLNHLPAEETFWLNVLRLKFYPSMDKKYLLNLTSRLREQVDQFCPDLRRHFYTLAAKNYAALGESERTKQADLATLRETAIIFSPHHPSLWQQRHEVIERAINQTQDYLFADSLIQINLAVCERLDLPDNARLGQLYYYAGVVKRHLSENDLSIAYLQQAIPLLRVSDKLLTGFAHSEMTLNYLYLQANELVQIHADSAYDIADELQNRSLMFRCRLIAVSNLMLEGKNKAADLYLRDCLALSNTLNQTLDIYVRLMRNFLGLQAPDSAQYYAGLILESMPVAYPQRKAYLQYELAKYFLAVNELDSAVNFIHQALRAISPVFARKYDPFALPSELPPFIDENVLLFGGLKAQILCEYYLQEPEKAAGFASLGFAYYRYLDSMVTTCYHFSDDADELHALDILHQEYVAGINQLVRLHQLTGERPYLHLAHRLMDELRARRLYRQINRKKIQSIAPPEDYKLLTQEMQLSDSIQVDGRYLNHSTLKALIQSRNVIREALLRSNPHLYQTYFRKNTPSLNEVATWCQQENTDIVALSASREGGLIIFHYDAGGLTPYLFPDSLQMVDSIRAFAKLLFESDPHSSAELFSLSHSVFHQLFRPLWPQALPSRLIMMTDASLENIPFHGLFISRPGVFATLEEWPTWSKKTSIAYAHLLNNLLEYHRGDEMITPPLRVTAFVNAAKDESDLPYSYTEGRLVQKWFGPSAKVFFGPQATTVNFHNHTQDQDILIFSLHGQGYQGSLNNTGIRFRDKLLNYYDLLAQPMQARLVILNLCQGQQGLINRGEGMANLAQAFLLKGAQSVICTYQDVPDHRAAKLLPRLFRQQATLNLSDLHLSHEYALYLN